MCYQRTVTIGEPCNTFQTPSLRDLLKRGIAFNLQNSVRLVNYTNID